MSGRQRDIEDYGIVGNLETCALIAADAVMLALPSKSINLRNSILLKKLGEFRASSAKRIIKSGTKDYKSRISILFIRPWLTENDANIENRRVRLDNDGETVL
jgi:hypothetical protein